MKSLVNKIKNWYNWPGYTFYFPISFMWIWFCIKSRSLWFFSTSNPTLSFGGFEGESKHEMYLQLPQNYYPRTVYVQPKKHIDLVILRLQKCSILYPFIVKPEVGTEGILVRKIENEEQLRMYHKKIPVAYMIQDYVNYPLEVCIFYCRRPFKKEGEISGFISKQPPVLKGDGVSTIKELLKENGEANTKEEVSKLHPDAVNKILTKGELFYLSVIGNRYHGSKFYDLSGFIDRELLTLFDKISLTNNFYYGRYDIKCLSVEDLKKGKNFSILEFNGAGSIPNHVFAGKFTLMQAYREVIIHWKILYEISNFNRKSGLPYWKFLKGYRYLKKTMMHYKTLRKYDKIIKY